MSRVVLSQIKSLTLFAGKSTKARRLSPIPQLTCIGDGCKYYQPEVIRCWNVGGDGTDVDWKVRYVVFSETCWNVFGDEAAARFCLLFFLFQIGSAKQIYPRSCASDEWRYPVKDGTILETRLS